MLDTAQTFRDLSAEANKKAEMAYEKAEDLGEKYNFDMPEVCTYKNQPYSAKPLSHILHTYNSNLSHIILTQHITAFCFACRTSPSHWIRRPVMRPPSARRRWQQLKRVSRRPKKGAPSSAWELSRPRTTAMRRNRVVITYHPHVVTSCNCTAMVS